MVYLWAYLGVMVFTALMVATFLEETSPAVSMTEMVEHGIIAICFGVWWPAIILCFLLWVLAVFIGRIFG